MLLWCLPFLFFFWHVNCGLTQAWNAFHFYEDERAGPSSDLNTYISAKCFSLFTGGSWWGSTRGKLRWVEPIILRRSRCFAELWCVTSRVLELKPILIVKDCIYHWFHQLWISYKSPYWLVSFSSIQICNNSVPHLYEVWALFNVTKLICNGDGPIS